MEPPPDDGAPRAAAAACVHRWVLATTTAGETRGTCRLCGVVRTFTNARRTWARGPRPPRS